MMKCDIVLGMAFGDEAKCKCTYDLMKKNKYTHVMRGNGSNNVGATFYHNGKKHIFHMVPVGVALGIKSIIGPGCVTNPEQLSKEIEELEKEGFQIQGNLFVDKRTHVITKEHIEEDRSNNKIGTTGSGNGQAYSSKSSRKGMRFEDLDLSLYPKIKLIDTYKELFIDNKNASVLYEGAQGFALDIDWTSQYPWCTSSHCTTAGAMLNGIPPKSINRVYGAAKSYTTYSGFKNDFQGDDPIFDKIAEIAGEFGNTTGRRRKINWNDINLMHMAVDINGVTDLIINKMDILQQIDVWKVIKDGQIIDLKTEENYKTFMHEQFSNKVENIVYSYSPYEI